jgi:pimeloyl-ACP methyl ester carboxylesterase
MSGPRLLLCALFILTQFFAGLSIRPARGAPAQAVSVVTRDGVQLKLTYFPAVQRKGTAEAKSVTPVVMLHDYKETRAVFNSIVERLQTPGEGNETRPPFAAVTVDLRGHGDSTKQIFPNGSQVDLDAAKLNRQGLVAMATLDMEAVRSFLVGKNDAGELNINKLCIVGAGMGASVAANWALQDWSAPPLAIGKQGQDVKALVLVSPRWSYSGLSFQQPMQFRPLKESVAWLLIYGAEDSKVKADVARINKPLKRFHPETSEAGEKENDLLIVELPSKLQGSTLLRQVGAPVEQQIIDFIIAQVATKDYPWTSRRSRLP